MKYHVTYTDKADKILEKMDLQVQKRIYSWINKNLEGCEDPREHGKTLNGKLKDKWSYRVGNYRIIAKIQDDKVIILITDVGHRKEIYKRQH
ncbi:MAG: type II toxin-antitoxin system RelE/ParE family toxin [Synergistaceae bacterium]|nr:type II toxin-antitoxin system RelE/ParE family toxin [Synergistaceae bacterium]